MSFTVTENRRSEGSPADKIEDDVSRYLDGLEQLGHVVRYQFSDGILSKIKSKVTTSEGMALEITRLPKDEGFPNSRDYYSEIKLESIGGDSKLQAALALELRTCSRSPIRVNWG